MTQLNYHELTAAYTNQITKQIEESNNTLHPYMMTVRFKYIPLSHSNIKQKYRFFTDATWNQYSKTYRFIISQIDKHYNKRPQYNPLTYDFFDVDNTSKYINVSFTESTMPHIHSIYLVHEKTLTAFQSLANDQFYNVINHHSMCDYVKSIHAEPIKDIHRTVAYCSKFYDNCYAKSMRADYNLYLQMPITEQEKESLILEREHLPYQKIIRLIKESNAEIRKRFNYS
jgi:hypothetical protein